MFVESFVFGLANGLHCVGMCGPLAMCGGGGRGAFAGYHGARFVGYAAAGAIAGSLGSALGATDTSGARAAGALVLGSTMLLMAIGWPATAGGVPGLRRLLAPVSRWSAGLSGPSRAAALGAITPLLPCGLLYGVYAAAGVSGGWRSGSMTTAGFALGSAALLIVAQLNADWLRRRVGRRGLRVVQRVVLVAAAAALIVRGVLALGDNTCCGA